MKEIPYFWDFFITDTEKEFDALCFTDAVFYFVFSQEKML